MSLPDMVNLKKINDNYWHTLMKIFIFIVSAFFISSGFANINKNYLLDNIWSSNAVEIEPFSYLYEYGNPNESKKIDRILSFPSIHLGSFYLDERILLQSNISKIDTRFLYKLGFDSICEAKFFDLRENEYRRFVLSPITTYNLNDVAYKRSSIISEDYGTISYSPSTISVNCVWIPFRGKINEFNLKRNLDLQLLDNSFIYTTRFKLSNNDKAIISSKYSLTTREYSFSELNLFTKKILYYFIKSQFLEDKTLCLEDILTSSYNLDKKVLEQINFLGRFFEALLGDWIYSKAGQSSVKVGALSKPYVYLFFEFEKCESIFFTDYVLENDVLDFGAYSKDEFLSALPKNRKYLTDIKYLDTGMNDFTDLKVKPYLILFFNPFESRLYMCKYNEVKFNRNGNINLSSYSSFYYYDIPVGEKVPLSIYWKTDYSNFKERNIIKSPKELKWELSSDFSEIKEYHKNGGNWILKSTMKKQIKKLNER